MPERILTEINRRILTPNHERDDFWWMGFPDKRDYNWNPWINTNWLTCVLLAEQDEHRRIASIHKTMKSIENFLNHYPADGGSDEGPGYWNVAGGRLFDYLEFLRVPSDGRLTYYENALIRNIGSYVYKAHIHERYVVNFADAGSRANVAGEMIYRYGKQIDDPKMMAFGAWASNVETPSGAGSAETSHANSSRCSIFRKCMMRRRPNPTCATPGYPTSRSCSPSRRKVPQTAGMSQPRVATTRRVTTTTT